MNQIVDTIKRLMIYVDNIMKIKPTKCKNLTSNTLPRRKGVYMFLDNKQKVVYVGSCGVKGKGSGTLRSRIWGNHITGDFEASSLKKKLKNKEKILDSKKVRNYIEENFDIKYIELDDNELINGLEHFLIAIFNPKYND